MGKAIIYAVMGLITIGLLVGFGVALKLLLVMFLGRKKKKETREPLAHSPGCPCSLCRPGGPDRMHQHH
jgi:hypothetical protein